MQLTPEQGLFLIQVTLPTLKNEQQTTKRVIEAMPNGKGDYRPDPNAKSALELAWHIASAQNFFLSSIAAGVFDFSGGPRPDSVRDAADIAAWYDQSFAKNLAALSAAKAEQLVKIMDFRGLFQLPAVAFLQFHIHHEIHHRGQLSTYLRPMGGKVPAIYGESYDSAEAKKAAGAA
ncbi:MAG TPA: DinB family protein [Candidatus Eisenbacteria bacterium]|jgi:uncharacterized damage-inducible protein DinB|nr:DinB family protein [Candidatus Eisenbacteria bacterium]